MENDVMTPEQYQELLALGMDNAQIAAALEQQKAVADRLRAAGEMPQGQMAGRVYVAPNVLQFAGAMANQKVAGDKERAMAAQRSRMLGNTASQNSMVMRAILNGNRAPAAPGAAPGTTPPFNPYDQFRTGGSA